MPDGESTVVGALNELTALGTERDREQLAALLDRLDAARLRVLAGARRGRPSRQGVRDVGACRPGRR